MTDLMDEVIIPSYNSLVTLKEQVNNLEILIEYLNIAPAPTKEQKYNNRVIADKLEDVIMGLKKMGKVQKVVTETAVTNLLPEEIEAQVKKISNKIFI